MYSVRFAQWDGKSCHSTCYIGQLVHFDRPGPMGRVFTIYRIITGKWRDVHVHEDICSKSWAPFGTILETTELEACTYIFKNVKLLIMSCVVIQKSMGANRSTYIHVDM